MAIDTATKRASAMLDLGQLVYPPDGTISATDRGIGMEFYSGIAAASAAVASGIIVYWRGSTDAAETWTGNVTASVRWRGETHAAVTWKGEV